MSVCFAGCTASVQMSCVVQFEMKCINGLPRVLATLLTGFVGK